MKVLSIFTLLLVFSAISHAANYSFTGNFFTNGDVQFFNFSVGNSSNVLLRTWSYAGGTNAAGQLIPRGGFDPILALFDPAGIKIGQNDDGGCGNVAPDAVSGSCYDTYLPISNLVAGTYTVAVMEFDNFADGPSLADPQFRETGNFAGGFPDRRNRDSHWAFDITGVADAGEVAPGAVPEPGSMLLLAGGIATLAAVKLAAPRCKSATPGRFLFQR